VGCERAAARLTHIAKETFNMKRYRGKTHGSQRAALPILVFLGGTILACGGTSTAAPSPTVWTAFVYGVAKNASGQPLSGALLESQVYNPSCTGGRLNGASSPTVTPTDASGRFRQQVIVEDSATKQCLRLLVRMQDGSSRVGTEVTGLPLKPLSSASVPYDSINATFTLP
jgi:hypothetical protein